MRKLELLAPARDAEYGRAAIDYGADAVYIGGPAFGARYAATNTVEDIARLADYAHMFGARVFVALNTIVFEDELPAAERIAREVIEAGADALIVQDMAFMRMGLSGAEMHASTQMCSTTPEQVRFLQESGFARVILERGLTLDEIRAIRQTTTVDLECFVHGAICVGFSGQCYLSRSMGPRSGNRGECSQPCRLPYDLTDERGKVIIKNKHLLSVQDMNLTARLPQLIDAGITSFKIEGRLKELPYVKNVVAHYRREIDRAIADRGEAFGRSSSGRTLIDFTPDPDRTFSRGGGLWMIDGKRGGVASFDTPKAMGAYIGKVGHAGRDYFEMDSDTELTPGDGICFIAGGELAGTNINRVEGRRIYPNKAEGIAVGTRIYRNLDRVFSALLDQSRTRRVVDARAKFDIAANKVTLTLADTEGTTASATAEGPFDTAANPERMLETLRAQAAKSGGSIFAISEVETAVTDGAIPFLPMGAINDLRRRVIDALTGKRTVKPPMVIATEDASFPYPSDHLGGEANVVNSLAERFYRDHGVCRIDPAFDTLQSLDGVRVMTTAYCLRRELGECLKESPKLKGRLFLRRGETTYRLEFDCEKCRMHIYK